jgi:Holliday junction resolvase RusA-like endonuclease
MRVEFTVDGKPKGKARHRTTRAGRSYSPKATKVAERDIGNAYRIAARSLPLMTGEVYLGIEAVFRIPTSWTRKLKEAALAGEVAYTGKPDKDNIAKLVMDALNGVAWVDDCQVTEGRTVKRYGEPERLEIMVAETKALDGCKSPAERRREQKAATGMVTPKRRAKRSPAGPPASACPAIGRRLR